MPRARWPSARRAERWRCPRCCRAVNRYLSRPASSYDSPLEGGVYCEPVSEGRAPGAWRIKHESRGLWMIPKRKGAIVGSYQAELCSFPSAAFLRFWS